MPLSVRPALLAAALSGAAVAAFAAPPGKAAGMCRFDPRTVETLSGEVLGIDSVERPFGRGIHLRVATPKESVAVHLGPSWFVMSPDEPLAKGDKVEIVGSRVTLDGKPVILAAELRRGEQVLRLRDDQGFPLWAGWRRRR